MAKKPSAGRPQLHAAPGSSLGGPLPVACLHAAAGGAVIWRLLRSHPGGVGTMPPKIRKNRGCSYLYTLRENRNFPSVKGFPRVKNRALEESSLPQVLLSVKNCTRGREASPSVVAYMALGEE